MAVLKSISYLLCLLFWAMGSIATAQETESPDAEKIKLIRADVISYDAKLVKAQRLIGNVILEHQGSRMYCDSAYLYEETERFESFGKVRITDQEDLTITGNKLDYNGEERIAKIYEEITLRDGEMTLTTDYIEYKLDDRMASYYEGGRIVSTANENVLTSESGHYFAEPKVMHFKEQVVLENPQYTMLTDTLHYHTIDEQSFFLGPTTIVSDDNKIYCENGWYDTQNDRARFGENAHIWSNEQQLIGDSIYYDRVAGRGEAFGSVMILDTVNRLQISGEYGRHLEESDFSFVTDDALLEQFFDTDTLLMAADTMLMRADTMDMRKIYAYHGVRIYKTDMQGVCDSLVYAEADSLIQMYTAPFIWNEANQISGERIDIKTFEGEIYTLYTENMAFITSEVDTMHYNQIKGRTLLGTFKDNALHRVIVDGNGESIFYATEDEDPDEIEIVAPRIIGVNKGTCSRMTIRITDQEIDQVTFITDPDNAFYPMSKIDPMELKLADFKWESALRPKDRASVYPVSRQ